MNPLYLAKLVRRGGLMLVLLGCLYLYWAFGFMVVPKGMDAMSPKYPPGTSLLVQERIDQVQPGYVVYLQTANGGMLLTQVAEVLPDGRFHIRHENRASRFVVHETQGPYEVSSVRGFVLTGFLPDDQ